MSTVVLGDRLNKTLTEFVIPRFRKNFWLTARKPMLRAIGMPREEADVGDGSNVMPRVQQVERVNSAYEAEVIHNHTPFGGGTYAQEIGATLRPGKFKGSRSSLRMKFITQSMEIPDQIIHASRSPEFSITNELVENMEGAMHTMHAEMNRQMVGNANGVLAYANGAVSSSNVFTVQTNTSATNEVPGTKSLQEGDVLLIGTAGQVEAGTAQTVTVSSVDSATQFTSTTDETTSDEDVIVRADVYNSTDTVYNEIQSLSGLLSNTGTVQNINKSNNYWFQSEQPSAVGALALADIDDLVSATRQFATDPAACFLLGNRKQWRRYSALLQANRRFNHSTPSDFSGNLVGGSTGLSVYTPDGEVAFAMDDDVPDGVIYLVDPNGLAWMNFREFGPADDALTKDGFPGQRKSGTLNYEFALWVGGNLAQTNARASGKLTGITS
jgi:hypothetical protein